MHVLSIIKLLEYMESLCEVVKFLFSPAFLYFCPASSESLHVLSYICFFHHLTNSNTTLINGDRS